MRFEDFDKTIESRKENMIILYGSENKPLDNGVFRMFSKLRSRLGRDYKLCKKYFDSEDLEFAYNNLSIRNDKSLNELKYVLDAINSNTPSYESLEKVDIDSIENESVLKPNSISPSSFVWISKSLYISFTSSNVNILYVNEALASDASNLSADTLGLSLSAIGYIW